MSESIIPNPLLDVPGLAASFNISERLARELFNKRAFPLVKIGRRLYVRVSDADAYFTANTIPAKR